MGALLLGDLADRDRALAKARERGRAEGVTAARREGAAALDVLRTEHARALAAAAEHERAAASAAYRKGLAEAAPEWQARAQRAEAIVAQWLASADALWAWRADMDGLVDGVLDYLGDRQKDPWATSRLGEYVEAVHNLRRAHDRCLELALERVAAGHG